MRRHTAAEKTEDTDGAARVCRVNGHIGGAGRLVDDAEVRPLGVESSGGNEIYRRTLCMILVMAVKEVLGAHVAVRNSLGDGYYCEVAGVSVTALQTEAISDSIARIVRQDLTIEMEYMSLERAMSIFKEQGNNDKAQLLWYAGLDPVAAYRCGDTYGHFYGPLASRTGAVPVFNLIQYDTGMVLQFPSAAPPHAVPPFRVSGSLARVFREHAQWLDVLGVATMGMLHERVAMGRTQEMIMVSEALYADSITQIARQIAAREHVRVVCIAGPSGSGKTTSAKRLSVQLNVCQRHTVSVSLDDYYRGKANTPLDEDGNHDFESLDAIDTDTVNSHISTLLEGGEVRPSNYAFRSARAGYTAPMKLGAGDILIVEGLHGLNSAIAPGLGNMKYGVFVSPLTGVSLDRHNRTSTADNRLLRRIVRDSRVRGYDAIETLSIWPSVMRGSHRHVFPSQENADVMLNTALIYELPVLKGYVEPLLRSVPQESAVCGAARRLLAMLGHVPAIPSDDVPNYSIIREFIGGSCLVW